MLPQTHSMDVKDNLRLQIRCLYAMPGITGDGSNHTVTMGDDRNHERC